MASIYASYIENNDTELMVQGTYDISQSFTPTHRFIPTSVKLKLRRGAISNGSVVVRFWQSENNTSGKPYTYLGQTLPVNISTITTADGGEWIEFTNYNVTTTLRSDYLYHVTLSISEDYGESVYWQTDSSNGYADGECWVQGAGGWVEDSQYDMMFEVWGNAVTYNWTNHNDTIVLGHSVSVSYAVQRGDAIIDASCSLGLGVSSSRDLSITREVTDLPLSLLPYVELEIDSGTFLCIAGTSGSIKTLDADGATWSTCAIDSGNYGLAGTYFAQYLNRLCVLTGGRKGFSYSAANDIITAWTEKPYFPNLPYSFTDLFVGRDASDNPSLYFLTPVGMFYLDVFTNFTFGPTELQWELDDDSGKKGMYWKGSTYVAAGKGIYRVTQGIVDLVGPDRDDGLPEDLQGYVSDMIGVGPWLVIAMDGRGDSKSCVLKKYITGDHWHPVYIGSKGSSIKCLFWDSGTLYFGEGDNIKSLPLSNMTDNVAHRSTYTYAASGDLIYPKFYSEFEAMPKVAHKIRAITENCNSNEYFTVYYRINGDTDWTTLGTLTDSPRPTALSFPASGDAVGLEFEDIQFKVSAVRGSTTTNSPKLVSLTLEYRVVPPVLWGWSFKVDARKGGDKRGQDIIDSLRTAIETSTLMTFYPSGDKGDTSYLVELTEMPGNESGTEFGTEGQYIVKVQEVIDS